MVAYSSEEQHGMPYHSSTATSTVTLENGVGLWADKFTAFPEAQPPEIGATLVTIRAVFVGVICGTLVNGSNVYLGLKTGWTSSANLLGSVAGFAILRRWSQATFGPHENNIVQTVATASAGLSNAFTSAIPAMYQLSLLNTPSRDLMRILLLTAAGGYFGLLSVVPLRRFLIENKSARDLNLIFPSSTVTALTIRSMHSAASHASAAAQQLRVTLWACAVAVSLRVLSPLATGVLWEWHIFIWMRATNLFVTFSIAAESWGWFIEWTPALIGSGMLVEINVAASFFAGSVLAWAVIGPYVVSRGMASGVPVASDGYWNGLTSYTSMTADYARADHPSPRYWLLWPGVACMIAVSIADLLCQWYFMFYGGSFSLASIFRAFWRRSTYTAVLSDEGEQLKPTNGVGTWMWAPGLVVAVAASILSMNFAFGFSVLKTLLALGLAFFLSLVAIQATGATDTTPLTAISTVSQIVLSMSHASIGGDMALQRRVNLLGGALANIGASQACDLMGDFRVGFLLRTPAKSQYIGQLVGTLVAAIVAPVLFDLFTTAYPCIIQDNTVRSSIHSNITAANSHHCEFSGPSIATWRAVAVAVSTGAETAIPNTSGKFALLLAGIGVAVVLLQNIVRSTSKAYFPNMMIMGLAFTMPSPPFSVAMLIGALVARAWKHRRKCSFERYGPAVAAGLVAGEGIGGIINGALAIAVGWGGDGWGVAWGCPGGRC